MPGGQRPGVSMGRFVGGGFRSCGLSTRRQSLCGSISQSWTLASRYHWHAPHSKRSAVGGKKPRGFDAGKKIKGRKRHALVDTDGRALLIEPHRADVQDRDGGAALLKMSRSIFPFIEWCLCGDGGYTGDRMANATEIIVEIVRKQADQVGFVLLPRRWVVERFFAWINRKQTRGLGRRSDRTVSSSSNLPSRSRTT